VGGFAASTHEYKIVALIEFRSWRIINLRSITQRISQTERETMDMKAFGTRIRECREGLRLRQSDIAGALQISVQAVSKWERGENAPDIATLPELAQLLGVSIEWLLGATTPQSDTFPATVLCTSINGFAVKASSMRPKELAQWINMVFFTLTETVKRFDGVPVKYVGDGFLCFFAGTNHRKRACLAALAAKSSDISPGLVVTLNTGDIFLGVIGHPDYTVRDILGETVNTAFLTMQWVSANCPEGIGATGSVVEDKELADQFEKTGELTLPGANKVAVYIPKKSKK
jgi:transcriptional regulator with XRE-family HTH domain